MTKIIPKSGRAVFEARTVYEASCERLKEAFDRFDHIAVSFSGGKDSTAVLNVALEAARAAGRLPLRVYFFDEEAQYSETIRYVERVAAHPDIAFEWYCVPISHRNACSADEPFWYPWAPEKRHLWCRPLPATALDESTIPGFERIAMPQILPRLFNPSLTGSCLSLTGMRADESMRRRRMVSAKEKDNWLFNYGNGVTHGMPIYDWQRSDVWSAPGMFGWDFNKAYEQLEAIGVSPAAQRVCPPFGEEPLQGLWQYAQIEPDLWEKMLTRVSGAATAARYSRGPLYARGGVEKPDDVSWEEAIRMALATHPEKVSKQCAKQIAQLINRHHRVTKGQPMPDKQKTSRVSGIGWDMLYYKAVRGDYKNRKQPVFDGTAESLAMAQACHDWTNKDIE